MKPIDHFNMVWNRCDLLSVLHQFVSSKLTAAVDPDEILRAEWVARVSALDLYIHEKIAQGMLDIFSGIKPETAAYSKFQLPNHVISKIRTAASPQVCCTAFDLEIREKLSTLTFQDPDKIADGVRLISNIELWNSVAIHLGATQANKSEKAKEIKRSLSIIVSRRNKIAHEGDLQPNFPREPWPISSTDIDYVNRTILNIVQSIESVTT
ncbi:hypothetical protein [Aquitalea palustris]|uniref:hypothetical protein n=1 Tax=Aquitalea palustris TaxID=2480983 RepID=UPI0011C387CC|nr:hypothetical protein [Aquitalea palustris]